MISATVFAGAASTSAYVARCSTAFAIIGQILALSLFRRTLPCRPIG